VGRTVKAIERPAPAGAIIITLLSLSQRLHTTVPATATLTALLPTTTLLTKLKPVKRRVPPAALTPLHLETRGAS
jgi:hypothetical protein